MNHEYYFAYGSNLNVVQFARRCPAAERICQVTLPDFKLVFRGVADIIEAKGKKVEGAVYKITPACEAALDRYEGFPHLYYKRTFSALLTSPDGRRETVVVMFYVMRDRLISPPFASYYETIEEGYADWNISTDTLEAALRHAGRKRAQQKAKFSWFGEDDYAGVDLRAERQRKA